MFWQQVHATRKHHGNTKANHCGYLRCSGHPVIASAVFSTPGPTQTLPSYWDIEIEVESNGYAPDPQIITTVRGGQGLSFIQQIDVKVTRTDGIVETGIIPKPLEVGDFVSLDGTDKNHDRAEVWATDPQGTKVKIFDDYGTVPGPTTDFFLFCLWI